MRAWLERMVRALKFVELVAAVLALVRRMRDINAELLRQLTHLRRKRPRSETLERLERQLVLPIPGVVILPQARPDKDGSKPKGGKGRHPGRTAPPAYLERVQVLNPVPKDMRICPRCGMSVVMKMEGMGIEKKEGHSESEGELGVVGLVQDVVDSTAIVTPTSRRRDRGGSEGAMEASRSWRWSAVRLLLWLEDIVRPAGVRSV